MRTYLYLLIISVIFISCTTQKQVTNEKMDKETVLEWENYIESVKKTVNETDDVKILLKLKHGMRDLYMDGLENYNDFPEDIAMEISRLNEEINDKIKIKKQRRSKKFKSVDIVANKIDEYEFVGAVDDGTNTVFTEDDLKSSYRWPLNKINITSLYGFRHDPFEREKIKFHQGIDLAAEEGSKVFCSNYGRVIFAGENGGYGLMVIVAHKGGILTVYGHLSKILVNKGKILSRGEVLGLVGSTGRSTGPHLHFEIRKNNKSMDPILFMKKKGR